MLQVNSSPDENQPKDKPSISIEQSIAATFQLRLYGDVIVNKVDANSVVLDSVELIFKDQYLSRSDMWRIREHLKNSVVFLNKKFEKHVRFHVFEMWSHGEKVASGYINNDTKIVFRSASSMVYLFIQMSSEMWDFDVNGDLYFEKAVNGFLSDLFEKWKKFTCNHDVTIVLFSRTFYEAKSIEEFPEEMRDCLQQDYRGKFYEDFYRVAIQNERYDEWNSTIILLKKLFNSYEKEVLRIHEKYSSLKIPKAYNSTASQGNFLEVLNMSLNVFEKHYLDRSFDRTGQLSVVISPGVGVFEVDQDLTSITKQRIIDNGIGSDLVCLGEQPLHAVPLFKFNRKQNEDLSIGSNYNMPHWINLSFYTSKRQSRFYTFVPRIKMPNIVPENKQINNHQKQTLQPLAGHTYFDNSRSWFLNDSLPSIEKRNYNTITSQHSSFENLEAEYDKYDSEVFSSFEQCDQEEKTVSVVRTRKKSVLSSPFSVISTNARPEEITNQLGQSKGNNKTRKLDELDGPKIKISKQDDQVLREEMNFRQQRRSINPFNPKHIPFKLTSNRRRWTHVFPLGPTGIFMQQHHYRTFPQNTACTLMPINSSNDLRKTSSSYHLNTSINIENLSLNAVNMNTTDEIDTINDFNQTPDQLTLYNYSVSGRDKRISFSEKFKSKNYSNVTLTYGNHEENFVLTSGITTGVDWKSLIIPACLPLTTDFLPDTKTLENDYLDSEYSLIPELQGDDLYERRCYKDEDHHNHFPLKTDQVFQEFVCQRLQQGFQVVMNPSFTVQQLQSSTPLQANTPNMSKTDNLELKVKKFNPGDANLLHEKLFIMSIGRIFHRLQLDDSATKDSTIKVKTYRPRLALNNNIKINYCYRFRAPDSESYIVSWVDFVTERLENYNWSYLDNYICLRGGDYEYELRENLKFWRLRMLLLPSMQQQTKQIIENITQNNESFVCDIYSKITALERVKLQRGFLRFFAIINRIKNQPAKAKEPIGKSGGTNLDLNTRRFSSEFTSQSLRNVNTAGTHFRERIQSENPIEKPRRLHFSEKLTKSDDQPPINEMEFRNSVENINNLESVRKLGVQNLSAIVDAMRNGFNGFQFLPKQGNLPNYLFTSVDAVQWAMQSVEGILNEQLALNLFQKLLDNKLIYHASGQAHYPFKYGFFLYYIVMKNLKPQTDDRVDLEMYKREWFEVEISNPSFVSGPNQLPVQQEQVKLSLLRNPINSIKFSLNPNSNQRPIEPNANNKQTTKGTDYYKSVLDTDFGSKSKRTEWLHIKYQQVYDPVQAFEIVLEWMVSTSNQIAEIVQGNFFCEIFSNPS